MVIVDPDYDEIWRARMKLRRKLLENLQKRADLIRVASQRAKAELEAPVPPVPPSEPDAERS